MVYVWMEDVTVPRACRRCNCWRQSSTKVHYSLPSMQLDVVMRDRVESVDVKLRGCWELPGPVKSETV